MKRPAPRQGIISQSKVCLRLERSCLASSGLSLDVTSLWSTWSSSTLSTLEISTCWGFEALMEVGVSKTASAAITLPSVYSNCQDSDELVSVEQKKKGAGFVDSYIKEDSGT